MKTRKGLKMAQISCILKGLNGFVNRRSRVRISFPAPFLAQNSEVKSISGGEYLHFALNHSSSIADSKALIGTCRYGLFYLDVALLSRVLAERRRMELLNCAAMAELAGVVE